MDELDLWRMGETFSLTTAAALICGIRPSRVHDKNQFGDEGYSVWHGNGNDPGADHDDAPELFLAASVKMKQIEADAHGAGHAWRTIERAKNRMHVEAYKEQKPKGKWVVVLTRRRPPRWQ